jgi:predicted ATPase
LLGRIDIEFSEAVPLIAALLSIPLGDRYPPPALSPQKLRRKTLDVLLKMVDGLAKSKPLLMMFEDVQ